MSLIKPVWPVLAAMAFLILQPGSSRGQEWGSLKGRISYGDAAPAAVPLDIERDADVCGKNGLVDESLVVHPENRGLRYVAVWLESKTPVPVHPELVNFPADSPVLNNINCRFEPHMLTLRTGQILQLKNSDPVAHNAAVYVRRTTPFSEVIPQNAPVEKRFAKAENLPTRVDCSIHAWMKAWLIILDHPYVAITDEDGRFEINNLPQGEWNFRFWHERPGYLPGASQDGKQVPLTRGTWAVTIGASKTLDLGELTVAPEQLAGKKR